MHTSSEGNNKLKGKKFRAYEENYVKKKEEWRLVNKLNYKKIRKKKLK